MPKRRSKKKKSFIRSCFKYSFLAIKMLFKGIFISLKWLFRSTKTVVAKSSEQVQKTKTLKKRKEISAALNPVPFSLIEPVKGDLTSFEKSLLKKSSLIGLILGARGTGKSAIGLRILENIYAKSKRNCYCIGFKEDTLPHWINAVENIDEINNNGVVLIDEGGILFSSRKSMGKANKLLSELLLIARHKDLSILFITQNSSNLEINAIRQADFLLMKPSSLLQKDFERNKIRDIYEQVANKFEEHKSDPGLTYVYSNDFVGFASNSLPSFWSSDVSKSFKNK